MGEGVSKRGSEAAQAEWASRRAAQQSAHEKQAGQVNDSAERANNQMREREARCLNPNYMLYQTIVRGSSSANSRRSDVEKNDIVVKI